jgi:hypothetical protein
VGKQDPWHWNLRQLEFHESLGAGGNWETEETTAAKKKKIGAKGKT